MKEFNKEEYDRLCAEFMGWEYFPESKSGNTWPDGCHDGSYTSFSMWIKNPTEKYREILCHDGYEYLDGEYNSEIEQSDLFEDYKYQLKYDSDWNEIMEVVEKIKSIDLKLSVEHDEVTGLFITSSKKMVVQKIWEFLLWYNQQEKEL